MTIAEPASAAWVTEAVTVAGNQVNVARAGSGSPLVVLPRDTGHPPRTAFLDELAGQHTVYYPWYPGFHGGGEPAAWDGLTNARDLAIVQLQLLDALGLGRTALVGLGFGGWMAAEVATMAGPRLDALVLVGAMGIRPVDGFIHDQFISSTESYARTGFASQAAFEELYGSEPGFEQLESWETDREMTSRLAWKPYMHNRALPSLLSGVKAPSLIVWGAEDQVVPVSCAEQFRAAIAGAKVEVLSGTGHAVDLEQPAALAAIVSSFLKARRG